MTDPYGQQSFGQQPGGQQPFGQPQPGQAPPFGQQAPYGQPAPFGQQGTPFGAPRNYANWGQRALGWLVDFGPAVLIYLVLAIVGVATHWNVIFSLLAFVASLAIIGLKGFNYALEFTGGTVVEARFDKTLDVDAVRKQLDAIGYWSLEV